MYRHNETILLGSVSSKKQLLPIAVIAAILVIAVIISYFTGYAAAKQEFIDHTKSAGHSSYGDSYPWDDSGDCALCSKYVQWDKDDVNAESPDLYAKDTAKSSFGLIPLILILAAVVAWRSTAYELTITEGRICGKTALSSQVDIPLETVTAVTYRSSLNGVVISTTRGNLSFYFLDNAGEICDYLNGLLARRQTQARYSN